MGVDDIMQSPDLSKLAVNDADGLYQLQDYQIGESLGYLLKRTVTMLNTAIDEELARYDLTHQQFAILMMLTQHNCSTAADLARETCGDTGAITRMLDRLEAKGIVRRVRSTQDRRVVDIELTDAGKLFAKKMPIIAINVLNRHLNGFDKQELETLKGFLRRLLHTGNFPVLGSAATE
jgi:DNA-binding MarR family transcriptional regulator